MYTTTAARKELQKSLESLVKLLQSEMKPEIEAATEELLELGEIPLKIVEKMDLKKIVAEHCPKTSRGVLLRRIQLQEEEVEYKKKEKMERDPMKLEDSEEDEIRALMSTPTKEDFVAAKKKLKECGYKKLSEENKDAVEFTGLLLTMQVYRESDRRTPSPTKEDFTGKMKTEKKRKVSRKLLHPYASRC